MAQKREQMSKCTGNDNCSMYRLIRWNIAKVKERNPNINLKNALEDMWDQMENDELDINTQTAEERYLACALFAWQRLGHRDIESMCRAFITNEDASVKSFLDCDCELEPTTSSKPGGGSSSCLEKCLKKMKSQVTLVNRMDNGTTSSSGYSKSVCSQRTEDDIKDEVQQAGYLELGCEEKLSALGKSTEDMMERLHKLERRETDLGQFLERAEVAWKDLEHGYKRQLTEGKDKEAHLNNKIQSKLAERNEIKKVCLQYVNQLKELGDSAETDRQILENIDKRLQNKNTEKSRLQNELTALNSSIANMQCKTSELERDYQLREDQKRRKKVEKQGELQSAKVLTTETERALRAELIALKEQVNKVSKELLDEEDISKELRDGISKIEEEKALLIEDLEKCKIMCDERMQEKTIKLKENRAKMKALHEKVFECRCKMPMDQVVEVKRTPSLARLCLCAPGCNKKIACSCASLKSSVLIKLLETLFNGLLSEINMTQLTMSCELLKCLEDKHDWNQSSTVKMNLNYFFTRLLVGELKIAIVNSIDKYHAQWIGNTCAQSESSDSCPSCCKMRGPSPQQKKPSRPIPAPPSGAGAISRYHQKCQTTLYSCAVMNPFEDTVGDKKAHDIEDLGSQPENNSSGTCSSTASPAANSPKTTMPVTFNIAAQTILTSVNNQRTIKTSNHQKRGGNVSPRVYEDYVRQIPIIQKQPVIWKATNDGVKRLRTEIENLKKDSIKKQDLIMFKKNLIRSLHSGKSPDDQIDEINCIKKCRHISSTVVKPTHNLKKKHLQVIEKPELICRNPDSSNLSGKLNDSTLYHEFDQAYSVNLCLCNPIGETKKKQPIIDLPNEENIPILNRNKTKPIPQQLLQTTYTCQKPCACLNTIPSTTSIDELLDTLKKWHYDADGDPQTVIDDNISKTIPSKNKKQKNEHIKQHSDYNKDSEYIVAINLEKSSLTDTELKDSNCEKDENFEKKSYNDHYNEHMIPQIHKIQPSLIAKSEVKNKNGGDNYIYIIKQNRIYDVPENTYIRNNEAFTNQSKENNRRTMNQIGITNTPSVYCIQKERNLMSASEYQVKFLGVTLGDVPCDTKNNYNKNTTSFQKDTKTNVVSNTTQSEKQSSQFAGGTDCQSCQCDKKIDELQNILNICLNGKHNITYLNEAVDTKSLLIDNEEEIDAKFSNFEVTQSTHTANQQLSSKLEFDSNKQKFGQPLLNKDNLFHTIIEKIKQTIASTTKNKRVKCDDDSNFSGSWKKAYTILHEYLKSKMSRIQDKGEDLGGFSPENTLDFENKISQLIEQDFYRLRQYIDNIDDVYKDTPVIHRLDTDAQSSLESKELSKIYVSQKQTNYNIYETSKEDQRTQTLESEKVDKSSSGIKNFLIQTAMAQVNFISSGTEIIKVNDKRTTPCNEKIEIKCLNNDDRDCANNVLQVTRISKEVYKIKKSEKPCIGESPNKENSLFPLPFLNSNIEKGICSQNVQSNQVQLQNKWKSPKPVKLPTVNTNNKKSNMYQCRPKQAPKSGKACCLRKNITDTNPNHAVDLSLGDNFEPDNGKNAPKCKSINKSVLNFGLYKNDKTMQADLRLTDTVLDYQFKRQKDCNCNMVPLCHVKMLLENIENNLHNQECTCDSLMTKVCPAHSQYLESKLC